MHQLMNITGYSDDVERYESAEDLENFLRSCGLDGVELMDSGEPELPLFRPERVYGVHLPCYSTWMPLWTGDKERLVAEFGSEEAYRAFYGGDTREALVKSLGRSLETAGRWNPEYLVLHLSECSMADSMLRHRSYSDEAVTDAMIDLVNQTLDRMPGTPWLLFENLWYDGLTMERPEIVERLLAGVRYPKTGIMLDLGHLMHTNMDLRTSEEAVDYFHTILDRYDDLSIIHGIHLHQSLSGAFYRHLMETWQPTEGDYYQRMGEVMGNIFQIDTHRPFLSPRIGEILRRIEPDYLTIELISCNRREHEAMLRQQRQVLTAAGIAPAKW